jgi:hypothetical protein
MAGTGGSGIIKPPSDDENVAPVIPIRQRQPPTPPRPAAAGKRLARENAAFDPEPEPGEVVLRQRRARRATTGITRVLALLRAGPGWRRLTRRIRIPVLAAGVVLAAVVVALPLLDSTRPPRASRSHAAQDRSATVAGVEPIGPAVAETPSTTRQTAARRARHTARHHARPRSTRRHVAQRAVPAFEQVSDVTPRAATTPTVATPTTPQATPTTPTAGSGSSSAGSTASATHSSSTTRSSGHTPAFGAGGALGPGSSPSS